MRLKPRTLPGETGAQIDREVESLLEGGRAADPNFEASHRTLLVREPFEIGRQAELVTIVTDAAAEVLPDPVKIAGASYWADAAFIAAAGISTVLFEPADRARTRSRSGSASPTLRPSRGPWSASPRASAHEVRRQRRIRPDRGAGAER